jgi:two-component system response regulator HydG
MTSFGRIESAIGAIRAGAYDFATKPRAFDALSVVLGRAIRRRRLREELAQLREQPKRRELPNLIGNSPAMARAAMVVSRIAAGDAGVLITGDSGTGKELVAKAIHERSGRKGPFLAINYAALPEKAMSRVP